MGHRWFFLFVAFYSLHLFANDIDESIPVQVIEDQSGLSIRTPSMADVKHRKLRLENGLEAYLISDPQAEKSAAALSVGAGSWHNPDSRPGLAHFLEHMLFLGTTKYPEESAFDRYVKERGGLSNAYTADVLTNYMFEVQHDAFAESLDRWSWFFREPLFNPSGVDRELQAVDQEFARKYESDETRIYYISKALANPEHPFSKFSVGNLETLGGTSKQELQTFYDKYYVANLMKLVLYSPLSLDELQTLVVERFSQIPSGEITQEEITVIKY